MATAAELLVPLRPGLTPVPSRGELGVCRFCHSGCDTRFPQCVPCHEADRTIGAIEILPIAMSIDSEMFHRHLRGYKDDRDLRVRPRFTQRLAALVAVFMHNHGGCVGTFDSVTAVPSPARTAMNSVLNMIPPIRAEYRQSLRATGVGGKHELRADRFGVVRDVRGERVLVIDDTFTMGPTMFSAVAALREAEAVIVGPVVLGRHVRPGWEPSREMLSWLQSRQWDDQRCCRCNGERIEPASDLTLW